MLCHCNGRHSLAARNKQILQIHNKTKRIQKWTNIIREMKGCKEKSFLGIVQFKKATDNEMAGK